MQVRPQQLQAHLAKQLLPVYLVFGDEPLQISECSDAIRAAARANGAEEREVLDVEARFDWNRLRDAGESMGLFASRKLIELRINKKLDKEGSAAITDYLADPNPDNVLLVTCGKLDRSQQRAKWFTALDKSGANIAVYPVERRGLPQWIGQRLSAVGIQAEPDALALLANRVEGNLLAAAQEVEKLKVLHGEGRITLDDVQQAVSSSARYNVFQLLEETFAGRAANALHMLQALLAEGSEEIPLLSLMMRDLRLVHETAVLTQQRQNPDPFLDKNGVWDKRKGPIKAAANRLTAKGTSKAMKLASNIDKAQKGLSRENTHHLMADLVTLIAGTPLRVHP